MKKYIFMLVAAMLIMPAHAQFWRSLGNAAERAAENAAIRSTERVTENAINRAVDGAEDAAVDATTDAINNSKNKDKNKDKKNKNNGNEENNASQDVTGWTCPACGTEGNTGKFCNECGAKKPEPKAASEIGWTCPVCGTEGNTGKFCNECGAKRPDGGAAATWVCQKCGHEGNSGKFCDECGAPKGAQKVNQNDMAWNNYDFVAGDEILFEDDNSKEPLGEFPQMWDAFQGAAEIVQINGVKCINLQDAVITPLYQDNKTYLTDVCTIEFDVYYRHEKVWEQEMGEDLHGWGAYDIYLSSADQVTKDNVWNGDMRSLYISLPMQMDEDLNTKVADQNFSYHWRANGEERHGEYILRAVEHEAWHHIAISFNKRAYKIYFDNQRVANIPNAMAPKWLAIHGSGANQRLYFIKNIRIAKGAVPLYDRMASEGRIITYGITFDVGKATIKPESMGEINRIYNLMNDNPDLKFEVQGHTDNTGNASLNQTLSEQRAAAIVNKLVGMGIAADRLSAVGKGQTAPIADNSTDEGRAKNRRVEFVKK